MGNGSICKCQMTNERVETFAFEQEAKVIENKSEA
jgi:hypothetical protein